MTNERLVKLWNEIYYDYLTDDEYIELTNYYKEMESENKELKEKINTAINYIKTFEYYIPEDNVPKLLEILGDKE